MKKIVFIIVAALLFACSNDNKSETVIKELAKKDIIEKLQLPEGTKFVNEDIELTETPATDSSLEIIYLVKITVKSQDRNGNENVKTYFLNYKRIDEDGSEPSDYELISFE